MPNAKISALGCYVPPRVLTNADLEKLVETTDEWILTRTGIRERHIADPGVATSDLGHGGGKKRVGESWDRRFRGGGDHCLHRNARHDVPLHRLPGAAQAGREEGLGLRSDRGLFLVRLRSDHRARIW